MKKNCLYCRNFNVVKDLCKLPRADCSFEFLTEHEFKGKRGMADTVIKDLTGKIIQEEDL